MTTALRQASLTGAALLAAGLLACVTPPHRAGQSIQPSGEPVKIELKLPSESFALGEYISLFVTVTNDSAAAVQIPDPFYRDNWHLVYTITGPSYPEGHSFTFRSAVLHETNLTPEGLEPKLITIARGQKVETDVPLHKWAPTKEPGEYRIAAALKWAGMAAHSAPVRFTMQNTNTQSASVGVDVEVNGTPGEWVEWFDKEPAGQRLYTSLFLRPHVDVRGYKPQSIDGIHSAPPHATDLLSPWTVHNRMAELVKWRAWREGATLVGLVAGVNDVQRLELGSEPNAVLRPALMTASGELDVAFSTAEGNELALARFPAPNFTDAPEPGRILWKTVAPGRIQAGRTALAKNNDRHFLVVTQQNDGIALHHQNAGSATKAGKWTTAHVPGAFVLSDSEPGLRVSADNTAHASLVVTLDHSRHELAVVDVTFSELGKASEPKIKSIGSLGGAPRAAVAAFTIEAGAATRREWVVITSDDTLRHSVDEGTARPLRSKPAMPLQLVVHAVGSYLLGINGEGKASFELMD